MDGMCVPTSGLGHRPLGDSATAEVTVLGQHSLLALAVGKEVAGPGLNEPMWFSSLARSLKEPGPAPTQKLPRCSAGQGRPHPLPKQDLKLHQQLATG